MPRTFRVVSATPGKKLNLFSPAAMVASWPVSPGWVPVNAGAAAWVNVERLAAREREDERR
jgi:hypothetical protein